MYLRNFFLFGASNSDKDLALEPELVELVELELSRAESSAALNLFKELMGTMT